MSAPAWGAVTVIRRCLRCGSAAKVRRDFEGDVYCSNQCREWAIEEATRLRYQVSRMNWQTRRDRISGVPLHTLYPSMLAVLDAVQQRRPSYTQWLGINAA